MWELLTCVVDGVDAGTVAFAHSFAQGEDIQNVLLAHPTQHGVALARTLSGQVGSVTQPGGLAIVLSGGEVLVNPLRVHVQDGTVLVTTKRSARRRCCAVC